MILLFGLVAVLAGYFIGNISPAILIGKMAGLDIKKEGSGNAGTTNVLRVLGKRAAIATLFIDVLKGTLAVYLGQALGALSNSGSFNIMLIGMVGGIAAICGHTWPIIFGFRGGKGAATSLGAVIGISPLLGLACFTTAITLFIITRRASIASIVAAILLPLMSLFIGREGIVHTGAYLIWTFGIAVIVVFNHRSNIKRLLKNEEPKIKFRKESL
jgi:glycerol-3-phosphate acyltransferase PlsY